MPRSYETGEDGSIIDTSTGARVDIANPGGYSQAVVDSPEDEEAPPVRVARIPSPAPVTKPGPKPVGPDGKFNVVKAAKARVRTLKAEIKKLKSLEKELHTLQRLLAAAERPIAVVQPIKSTKR